MQGATVSLHIHTTLLHVVLSTELIEPRNGAWPRS